MAKTIKKPSFVQTSPRLRPVSKASEGKEKITKKEYLIPIYNLNGEKKKTIALPKEVFGVKINNQLLAQYVRVYLINQRQGTASTKTRSEVTGSTRKIYRQKGTGRARHGDIKAPVFIGGGIVGGPKPRNFEAKLNKKMKKQALSNSLTLRAKEGNIICLADDFENIKSKTKLMANFLKKLSILDKKILLVLSKLKKANLFLAARNLPKVKIVRVEEINPYFILNSEKILFLESSLEVINSQFLPALKRLKNHENQ